MAFKSDEQRKGFFGSQGNIKSNVKPNIVSNIKIKKQGNKNIPDFVNEKTFTEQQIKLLQRRLNDKKIKEQDIFGKDFDRTKRITPEQTKKGLDWLDDKRRTPTGKERLNNPFGAREEAVLDNFDRFELTEFFDSGNQFVSFKIPLWTVIAKDGSRFQYHSQGGKVNITG